MFGASWKQEAFEVLNDWKQDVCSTSHLVKGPKGRTSLHSSVLRWHVGEGKAQHATKLPAICHNTYIYVRTENLIKNCRKLYLQGNPHLSIHRYASPAFPSSPA